MASEEDPEGKLDLLVQVDAASKEARDLRIGEERFEGDWSRVFSICLFSGSATPSIQRHSRHSTVSLSVPASDTEDDKLYTVEVSYHNSSEGSLVVIRPDGEMLPDAELDALVARLTRQCQGFGKPLRDLSYMAREIETFGLNQAESRVRQIEEDVRSALRGDHLSDEDYTALRAYPERLALVEDLIERMSDNPPEVYRKKIESFDLNVIPDLSLFQKYATDLGNETRKSIDRLSGLLSSQQIVLTQRQAAEQARFQRLVTIVGAAVLVPGLFAAIFGANVDFRGRDSVGGYWAMLLMMVGSAVASYAFLRAFEAKLWGSLERFRIVSWFSGISMETRFMATGVAGLLLFTFGICLLLF